MTSINYSANGFSAVFKDNLKRCSGPQIAGLVLSVLFSFFLFGYIISQVNDGLIVLKDKYDATAEAFAVIIFSSAICFFLNIISAPRLFRGIYSKRATDFYFSAPIKRGVYFNANMLFAAIANIVITVLPLLTFLVLCKLPENLRASFDYSAVFSLLVAALLSVLAFFAVLVVCAVCSGRIIHYAVFAIISLFSTIFFASGIMNGINSIWGFYTDSIIFSAVNPLLNFFTSVFRAYNIKSILILSAFSVVEIAAAYLAGYILFKNRKAEAAELSVSGKIMPYIFHSVLVISAFLYLGFISNLVTVIISGIIFSVLVTLLYTVVLYRKPMIRKTAVTCAVVCAVCICFVAAVHLQNSLGYVMYVPETEEIQSVQVSSPYYSDEYIMPVTSLIENSIDNQDDENLRITFESEDKINGIRNFHKKIVDKNTINASKVDIKDIYSIIFLYDDRQLYDVKIQYNLKNGKTVSRTYSVDTASIYKEFVAAFKNEEALSQTEPFNLNKDDIAFMQVDYYGETDETLNEIYTDIFKPESYDELFNIYMDDLLSQSDEDFVFYTAANSFGMYYYQEYEYSDEELTAYADKEASDETVLEDYKYYSITLYTIKPDVNEETRKKLKNMTIEQISEYIRSDSVYEDDFFDTYYFDVDNSLTKNTMDYVANRINRNNADAAV